MMPKSFRNLNALIWLKNFEMSTSIPKKVAVLTMMLEHQNLTY